MFNDLDSAIEKIEDSVNKYQDTTLNRFECEALIKEMNQLTKENERMEWCWLILSVMAYLSIFESISLLD